MLHFLFIATFNAVPLFLSCFDPLISVVNGSIDGWMDEMKWNEKFVKKKTKKQKKRIPYQVIQI